MPGNIYHYFERESRESSDNKNNQENIDNKWKSRYEYNISDNEKTKSNITFIKRAENICAALSNDFSFDILN